MITVLYFAWLRDGVGTGREDIDPPPSVETVADLIAWLAARSDKHAQAFGDTTRLRCAVNQDYATLQTAVKAGDEVAFFPPVTGG
ncbi:molybdopterin converting factor subunit 1 [Caenispirillum bisanense]|uniref:Molybdopterin synthase sulfur carrier subunit n=1 Tax=Caenispirillum bisanense TaxID=414052 RepID=A0A286GHB3_9PROT|nr:molybdopterin converting factor subunit 1 [Caenispirillum bisanense]SOD94923.1 molybdopterin synthase subunit MoaD [Caenispirillum bisanense]